MSSPPHPMVVAGYDGSLAARAAVERGIDRVGSTGHLVVVIAHHAPADYAGASYYQAMLDDALGDAERLMDELMSACERLASVEWEPDLIHGPPGAVLAQVAETRGADEIIIGTRGRGRFRAALGSVAMDVLHHASCPVVVIPQRMFAMNTSKRPEAEAALARDSPQ